MKIIVIECSTAELAELMGVIPDQPTEVVREPTPREIREWAKDNGFAIAK